MRSSRAFSGVGMVAKSDGNGGKSVAPPGARNGALPRMADHRLWAGIQADGAAAHNQADAAVSMACNPVLSVGSRTGAKRGEWLLGMSRILPAARAASQVAGSVPPTNQNTDGAPQARPNSLKSSLAADG